jgi:hypothetical protein
MQPPASTLETRLPSAVRRQMERVNTRLAEREAARSAGAAPTPPKADDSTPASPSPNAAEPAQPGTAGAVPNAAPAPAPAAPSQDDREHDPAYWRDRFRLMQGINDKLRTDHSAALLDRDRQLGELHARVQELEQQAAARPASDKLDLTTFFTPDQIERFGEDQCEAMARAAVTAAQQQAQAMIDAQVKPLKAAADTERAARQQQVQDAFYERLTELVPDWQEINVDPAWLSWLTELDDEGEQRQKRLDRLGGARNAQGVAKVFRDFLKTKTPSASPPVAPPRSAGGGAPAGGDTPQTGGKGYPSREEIRDYTKRASTVRNRNDPRYVTEKERAEFEARLKLPKPGG